MIRRVGRETSGCPKDTPFAFLFRSIHLDLISLLLSFPIQGIDDSTVSTRGHASEIDDLILAGGENRNFALLLRDFSQIPVLVIIPLGISPSVPC